MTKISFQILINARLENASKVNNKDKQVTPTVFPAVLHTVNRWMEPPFGIIGWMEKTCLKWGKDEMGEGGD